LEFALGRARSFIIAHPEYQPDAASASRYREYVARRAGGEPFHYIKGAKEFYGLDFIVSPAVLIPRPETEMLVDRAMGLLSALTRPRFCEVGVGSGCISIAILAHVPEARAVGLEVSAQAIDIARANADANGVSARFDLRRSDIFASLRDDERFDLIVSNPPYIPAADLAGLQREVRDHEPRIALTDGADGLSIIRRLVDDAPRFLDPGGSLMFEFGMGQAEEVQAMFSPKLWRPAAVENDVQGIPRMVVADLGK
jgi:release factor glutamine methyltransferase